MLDCGCTKNLIFISITIAYVISTLLCVSPVSISSFLINSIGLSQSEIGFLSSITFLISGVIQPFVGFMTDKFGAKKVLISSFCFLFLSSLLCFFSESYFILVLSRILLGFAAGSIYVPSLKIIFESFGKDNFNPKNGIYSGVGCAVGFMIASSLLPDLIKYIGFKSLFLLNGLVVLVVIVLVFKLYQPQKATNKTSVNKNNISFVDIKTILFNKNIIILQLLIFLGFGVYTTFMGLWAIRFLESKLIFSPSQISFILAFVPIGYLIGSLLSNYLSTSIFKTKSCSLKVTIISFILSFVSITFLSNTNNLLLIFPYFLLGFSVGAFSPIIFGIITLIIPENKHGLAFGFVNPLAFLGIALFQVLTSGIFEYLSLYRFSESTCFQYNMLFSAFWLMIMLIISFFISIADKEGNQSNTEKHLLKSKILQLIPVIKPILKH